MSTQPRVIAHIDMDAFFAAVEQRDNPALRGQPVVIGADPKKGKGRGVVSTCSYEARRYGIHSAMPISQAYRACPQAHFLPGNMKKYKDISRRIFEILYDFTPDIEPISIDEAFLDITGSYHFYQTPLKTCASIKKRIQKDLGLAASIGIAPNKMVAKIASDFCKPNGLLEILPEKLLDFLWPLPVRHMWGIGKQTQKSLHAMGIQTIGDIAKADSTQFTKKFGAHGQHMHTLAQGIDERKVAVDDEIKSISHEHTFDVDTSNSEEIYQTLSHLSEKISRRLRRHALKGKTITVKIRFDSFKTISRARTLPERTNFYDDIYSNSKQIFDALGNLKAKFRLIGIRISNFHDPYVQESLFIDTLRHKKRENIHQAIDKIKDKFGEKAIHRGV